MPDDTADTVLREDRDGVTILTLNRPERRNAWTIGMQKRYFGRLQECVEDGSVRAIVVTGSGSTFCPGADTDELQVYTQTGDFNPEMAKIEQPDWYPMTVPKPMIAAINGAAAGFGLVQTMFCDARIAVPGARMSTAFARRGLPALHAASYLLPRLIGLSRAQELLVSGRTFTTDEAASFGLIHQIAPVEGFMDTVLAYAKTSRSIAHRRRCSTSRSRCAGASSRPSSNRCTMPKVASTPHSPRSTSTRA